MSDLQTYQEYYNMVYPTSTARVKILLKCWLYELSYKDKPLDFTTYTAFYSLTTVLHLLKGYCVDVSDIGTIEECIQIITNNEIL